MGLEDALSMGICGPEHDERSWTFDLDPGEVDPVLGIHFLRDAYEKAVDFITNGNPGWAPYDGDRRATGLLTASVTPADDPAGDERATWDGIR